MTNWIYAPRMELGVLGPLLVVRAGEPVDVAGVKERTLLAHLVAYAGRTVPVADLVDSLWAGAPPRTAAKSLQTYVLRVRRVLEPEREGVGSVLVTDPGGYRLAVSPDQVDAHRFAELAALGHRAVQEGRYDVAVTTLRDALALWRGPAYTGFEHTRYAVAEGRRLEELQLSAVEDRWRAELELGDEGAVVSAVERLLEEHPYRERLWSLLMLALYRSGRQGDALAAYDRARSRLLEDLGVEPGDELRQTQARVLAQHPALRPRRRRDPVPPDLVEPRRPLVGREEELALLESAWSRAVAGESVTVVLRGPPGAGASRLASALAAVVARGGRPVAYTADGEQPTAPVGGLLVSECPVSPPPVGAMTLQLAGPGAALPQGSVGLDLEPLGPDAVREIVASYVGPADVAAATEFVLRAGTPWPGAVHDTAVGWARDTARTRVATGASRLGEAATRLGEVRAQVVDSVVALDSVATGDRAVPSDTCPWRGLASYEVEDADWYAGRERLVAELLARVASGRVVAVVGASGSGKSSLLRAGLLAGLAAGRLPGSERWVGWVVRPGEHPLRELARTALGVVSRGSSDAGDALARLFEQDPGDDRAVLVVDQLEEAWTLCRDDEERTRFLDLLADLVGDERSRVTLVLAIRADYVGQLAEHPRLAHALADHTLLVGSPTEPEVERAVRLPASAAGLDLEIGLADALVADAGDEPGLLPLLSVALTQLWTQRAGDRLTLAAYVSMGGLAGAIAHLAEDAYQGLPRHWHDAARTLLLRLTGPGEGSGVTRRRVSFAELGTLPDASTMDVVGHLTDARLLTSSDGYVEIAHESLFREWPRLRTWIAEDVEARGVRHRLADAAREWQADGGDPTQLWRGNRLESGLELAGGGALTDLEREFLEESRLAVEADQRAAEERAATAVRQNRRLRRLLVGLAMLLVVALVAGVLAWRAQEAAETSSARAREASVAADAKRLAAQALNEDFLDTALLEAVEAVKLEQSPETHGALVSLLARVPELITLVRAPQARFLYALAGPDGRTVFMVDQQSIWAIEAESGEVVWNRDFDLDDPGEQPLEVALGPGGLAVTVASRRMMYVAVLDPETGTDRWVVMPDDLPQRLGDRGEFSAELAWSGDRLVLAYGPHLLVLGEDGRLEQDLFVGSFPRYLRAWPDGRVSMEVDPFEARIVDPAEDAMRMRRLPAPVVAVAPDGERVVTAEPTDADAMLLQMRDADMRPVSEPVLAHFSADRPRWSPDGSLVALTADEQVELRDGRTFQLVRTLSGAHSGTVLDVAFAGGSGDLVWLAGRDGLASGWDLTGARGVIRTQAVAAEPHVGEVSPGGRLAAYVRFRSETFNEAAVADVATGADVTELRLEEGCECQVTSVAMGPDDSVALGAVEEFLPDFAGLVENRGRLVAWSPHDGVRLGAVDLPWPPQWIDVTPDGRYAVVNGRTGWAVVDLDRMQVVGEPVVGAEALDGPEILGQVAVSRDGEEAVLARRGELVVVDPRTGDELRRGLVELEHRTVVRSGMGGLTSVTFSSDGSQIVAGGFTGSVHFLDARTLRPVAPARQEIDGWVIESEISPDGRWLTTLGTDGDLLLWDARSWTPLGEPLFEDGSWGILHFPDDSTVHALYEGAEGDRRGTARWARLDPADWVAAACRLANRDLTADEWEVLHPGTERQETCSGPPGS